MNQEHYLVEEGAEVAVPAWRKPVNRYGTVEGLEEDELASPQELERIYFRELWGPVLLLPEKKSYNSAWYGSVDVDYNAFATVDFDRRRAEFDKARFVRDKLLEQVKDLMIRMKVTSERIKDVRKYKVLRLVGKGLLDADDIQDGDLWLVAKLVQRVVRLKKEIARLQEASSKRKQQIHEKWLES